VPTDGWVFWVWNGNSGEPDGLVTADYQNIVWNKVRGGRGSGGGGAEAVAVRAV
jgi:hypothetical protein